MNKPATQPAWVAALLSKDLTPLEFRVWLLLYRYQGSNVCAWPSQQSIAADLGLTAESVRRIVKRLDTKGWIKVARPRHTAPGRGVRYMVQHPTGELGEHPTGELGEHPTDGLGVSANHPTGQAEITPPAKPRHIGRSKSRSKSKRERKRESARTQTASRRPRAQSPRRKFIPPTVEQVATYAESIGYALDAAYFVDHYTGNGWRIGKAPMRDWRATVRNWQRRDAGGGNGRIVCGTAPADEDEVREFLRHCRAEREGLPA